jgi:hypothetical protein
MRLRAKFLSDLGRWILWTDGYPAVIADGVTVAEARAKLLEEMEGVRPAGESIGLLTVLFDRSEGEGQRVLTR